VFGTTFYAVHNFKKSGPIWDTWDELAQYKLIYGLGSGLCVWLASMILTFPVAMITAFFVPTLMWMTLRWLEDAVSALRALFALVRLLQVGQPTLKNMYERRQDLHSKVMDLAVESLGLPDDPEGYFTEAGGREKGRVRGRWESRTRYFSVRRRRKKDWNETLRLYDKVDFPNDEM
jgi:glycerol-3-phosphate O-acyltransferase/dihydroxyacetone phosphate acyltransferase